MADYFSFYRSPFPTHIRVGGVVTGAGHWVFAGLCAIMNDYGTLCLIDSRNGGILG
jgi:hypothetical protein